MTLAPRFDLRLLRAAVAVRDAGSVTAAARRLGTSQPALSRLLAQLEAEIGFELFTRERRRLVPARRSPLFLDRAAAMVTEAERMRQLALGCVDSWDSCVCEGVIQSCLLEAADGRAGSTDPG